MRLKKLRCIECKDGIVNSVFRIQTAFLEAGSLGCVLLHYLHARQEYVLMCELVDV